MSKSFKSIVFAAAALLTASFGPALAGDPENTLIMELPAGKVVIELAPELAPKHVARVKELTRKGFYDGTPFHRVIDKFMAQGGDPTGTGTGGSGVKIPAEFSGEPFVRGVVGMARSADPNSADSQFFIMLGSAPSLDGRYTAIGKVADGMDAVDRIKKGDPAANGMVTKPDILVRMQVAADVKQ